MLGEIDDLDELPLSSHERYALRTIEHNLRKSCSQQAHEGHPCATVVGLCHFIHSAENSDTVLIARIQLRTPC